MLAFTLQTLIERKMTTAQELADLSGVAPSTVYRWISGESEPDFDAVRLLLRHLPHVEAQRAILACFTAGTPWQHFPIEVELDVNRDGRIDDNDALDAAIEAVQAAGDSLAAVREACKDRVIDADQVARVIHRINGVLCQCTITQRVLLRLAENRRKARPAAG
jgi:transcriptional regulator with XRE-family HTH domain